MAVLVLSVAGQALGGALGGALGAVIGNAVGALAGNMIDRALFGEDQIHEVNKLDHISVQSSTEGSAITKVYGRCRISGQVIWATHFEEMVTDREEGGKAGPTTTIREYTYLASFAVALCEGPVDRIGRIWADGHQLDQTEFPFRFYNGTESQSTDPLIEAKQGLGNTPAYRGMAYLVFDRLSTADFGNRIPQLSIEIIRVVEPLESMVRAITVIPGATEFGYLNETVTREIAPGVAEAENRHIATAKTNWDAAIDELTELCPNLESVALVVSWFGDDLRCDQTQIMPGVEDRTRAFSGYSWAVGGLDRSTAMLVSQVDGRPAFGGSPDDYSIVSAIADLKSRGLRVMLYPFIMMDIPTGNGLPDPYGGAAQAAYPWRGRITCHPAPGEVGTVVKTAAAATQIDAFVGTAGPSDFTINGQSVSYSGPSEWSYRRFVLHYAHLAVAAGGVDGFLIGSEMRGLTIVRDDGGEFPFVDALQDIAADVRTVSGGSVNISYAADWSEYFGYHPNDGSDDVLFHLDPLWAHADIDFIGIDNYMPLADWRDGDHEDSETWAATTDTDYLRANIAAGEGYDWYYSSGADRDAGSRTAITDGAYSKPWVYRYKDLVNWWTNQHFDRPGGMESASPTDWVPQSKPIWFTEIGCPAIDRGANQPNDFVDPKSSQSERPYFSNGGRDDLIQRRFLEAQTSFWDPSHGSYVSGSNPSSPSYGAAMVDHSNSHVWTWDARPFPVFPYAQNVWSDGPNWQTGHWVNGRLGAVSLSGLLRTIMSDYGFADMNVGELDHVIDGFAISGPVSARSAVEPLAAAFGFEVVDTGTELRAQRRWQIPDDAVDRVQLAGGTDGNQPLVTFVRAQESELPNEIRYGFRRTGHEFESAATAARRFVGGSDRITSQTLPVFAPASVIKQAAEVTLVDIWAGRDRVEFSLPPSSRHLEPGDTITLNDAGSGHPIQIQRIEESDARRIHGRTISATAFRPSPAIDTGTAGQLPSARAAPVVHILDLPALQNDLEPHRPWIACFAHPWPGEQTVWSSASGDGYDFEKSVSSPALVGTIVTPPGIGPVARWDLKNTVTITTRGVLQSRDSLDVFAGENALAVLCDNNEWEIIQFAEAELVAENTYKLSRLLRAQAGSLPAMESGASIGAPVVLLDRSVSRINLNRDLIGVEISFKIGPPGTDIGDPIFRSLKYTPSGLGERPYAPAHLRTQKGIGGEVRFSWIRRTRIGGDAWSQVEVPLGEETESYELDIYDGADVVRTLATSLPLVDYTAAMQTADFGIPPASIDAAVYQLSTTYGRGAGRREIFDV